MLDPAESGGVLGAIKKQFQDIYVPALTRMDKGWGDLAGEEGEKERSKFLNDIENFIAVLDSASSSSNTIELAPCTTYDLSNLKTTNDFYNVANSFESMEKIEACMAVWIKQIAQVCLMFYYNINHRNALLFAFEMVCFASIISSTFNCSDLLVGQELYTQIVCSLNFGQSIS